MRLAIFILLWGLGLWNSPLLAATVHKVKVAEPYIQLYTGPGKGYPILLDVPRGSWITVIKQQAGWFKVRTEKGKLGWVQPEELEKTVTADGSLVAVKGTSQADFSQRDWEIGTIWGETEGASLFQIYTGFSFNERLSIEVTASQMIGNLSVSYLADANIVAQPFPEWPISPFFTLGTGVIETKTRSILVEQRDQQDQTSHVGFGVKAYLTRSFFLRVDYREYVIFSSDNENEELTVWSVGVGSFF